MPISTDRFETIDDDAVSPETNADRITQFLLENDDLAYRMSEIVEALDIPRGSVGPTLSRLEDAGVVDHRANYWRISDHYTASAAGLAHTAEAASQYDDGKEFDVASWAADADDPAADEYQE
jgi:DNA-binding MarR family transcriptional regulator